LGYPKKNVKVRACKRCSKRFYPYSTLITRARTA